MPASADVPLRCRCGAMKGIAIGVSARSGNHVVCYCDDCQAYARHLGGAGRVDGHGGTEVFQTTPAQVRIESGREHLRCVRLTEKGLLRWYAGCCRTPVANTLALARAPFVGVVCAFMDFAAVGGSADAALGPPIARIHGRFAAGGAPPGVHPAVPLGLMLRSARLLLAAWIRGAGRPHPFFDAATGAPAVVPEVLTPDRRKELRT